MVALDLDYTKKVKKKLRENNCLKIARINGTPSILIFLSLNKLII